MKFARRVNRGMLKRFGIMQRDPIVKLDSMLDVLPDGNCLVVAMRVGRPNEEVITFTTDDRDKLNVQKLYESLVRSDVSNVWAVPVEEIPSVLVLPRTLP